MPYHSSTARYSGGGSKTPIGFCRIFSPFQAALPPVEQHSIPLVTPVYREDFQPESSAFCSVHTEIPRVSKRGDSVGNGHTQAKRYPKFEKEIRKSRWQSPERRHRRGNYGFGRISQVLLLRRQFFVHGEWDPGYFSVDSLGFT